MEVYKMSGGSFCTRQYDGPPHRIDVVPENMLCTLCVHENTSWRKKSLSPWWVMSAEIPEKSLILTFCKR